MVIEVSDEQARLLRFRAQRLNRSRGDNASVADVVEACCALQAQDSRQAPLGIRARGEGVTAANVEAARVDARSIVRTWCVRGTFHYMRTTDLPSFQCLFGPLYVERGQRRLTELGFDEDEDESERAMEAVRDALAEAGPLTRDEVAEHLLNEGFEFDPDGQAPVHVVRRACLTGIAVQAAPRDGEETYALLSDWVSLDSEPDRTDALAELARRYVAAYEPTTPEDFYTWSGLYKRDVRVGWNALKADLTEVDVAGERAWTLTLPDALESDGSPAVRLVPMYDSYFLGHQDRDLVLSTDYADEVLPGGGLVRAAVVVDGLAVGTWRFDRSRATARVTVKPFESIDAVVEGEIDAEVEDIGRFLGIDVEWTMASGK